MAEEISGNTLKAWRKRQGMTQFQLAVKAEVSLSTIVNIEHNRQIPNVNIARRIADALGVSMYDVVWPTDETLVPRHPSKSGAVAA